MDTQIIIPSLKMTSWINEIEKLQRGKRLIYFKLYKEFFNKQFYEDQKFIKYN